MKVYPPQPDGKITGFECSGPEASHSLIKAILKSVNGVSDVVENYYSEYIFKFDYKNVSCYVQELSDAKKGSYKVGTEECVLQGDFDLRDVYIEFDRHDMNENIDCLVEL